MGDRKNRETVEMTVSFFDVLGPNLESTRRVTIHKIHRFS